MRDSCGPTVWFYGGGKHVCMALFLFGANGLNSFERVGDQFGRRLPRWRIEG